MQMGKSQNCSVTMYGVGDVYDDVGNVQVVESSIVL